MPPRTDGLRELISRIGGRPAAPRRETCANCGITIDEEDRERSGRGGSLSLDLGPGASFCCDGCADGGPCTC